MIGKITRVERFFRSLERRTKVFVNNVNARKLHVNALKQNLITFLP
jgi:hypothetical protein